MFCSNANISTPSQIPSSLWSFEARIGLLCWKFQSCQKLRFKHQTKKQYTLFCFAVFWVQIVTNCLLGHSSEWTETKTIMCDYLSIQFASRCSEVLDTSEFNFLWIAVFDRIKISPFWIHPSSDRHLLTRIKAGISDPCTYIRRSKWTHTGVDPGFCSAGQQSFEGGPWA